MTKKSVLINPKAHLELKKLSESLRMNYGSLIEEMIYYFKKTGIDPKDAVNKNPSLMVAALDKRIVSFMKVQERDILIPLRNDVFKYQKFQEVETTKLANKLDKILSQHSEITKEIEKKYSTNLSKINEIDATRTKLTNTGLERNRTAILAICEFLDEKNKSGIIDKVKTIFS
jgi:vacuolar-type H+-ATPase subunit I/STV1